MTGQLNDIWVAYLQGQGYTGKQYNDLVRQALQDQTSSARKQVDDLWKTYLEGEGFSGSVQDMMYAWLGDKGYTGSLNDRWKQAIENDDVFEGVDPLAELFANGEQGMWYNPTDLATLFKDAARTDPVTTDSDPVGLMLDKSGNGNHASQSATAGKPAYGGLAYTADDFLYVAPHGLSGEFTLMAAVRSTNTGLQTVFGADVGVVGYIIATQQGSANSPPT